MDHSRSKVSIHSKERIKMDLVTDIWIRRCIGVATVLITMGVFALAVTPLISVIRLGGDFVTVSGALAKPDMKPWS